MEDLLHRLTRTSSSSNSAVLPGNASWRKDLLWISCASSLECIVSSPSSSSSSTAILSSRYTRNLALIASKHQKSGKSLSDAMNAENPRYSTFFQGFDRFCWTGCELFTFHSSGIRRVFDEVKYRSAEKSRVQVNPRTRQTGLRKSRYTCSRTFTGGLY
jgi:hypothetical protein